MSVETTSIKWYHEIDRFSYAANCEEMKLE